jgi:thiol-disulfide isomerase/thioredoxin
VTKILTGFVLLGFVFATGCGGGQISGSSAHPYLGRMVQPMVEGDLTNTQMVSVPKKGQVTVAYFWGTHCVPCKATMPELEKRYQAKKGKGLALVGIADDDNPGVLAKYLADNKINFPIVLDGQSRQFFGHYQCNEVPLTLVFDRAGALRMAIDGKDLGMKKLDAALEELL